MVSKLEDPLFDLIGWYMTYLAQHQNPRELEEDSKYPMASPHDCPPAHLFIDCDPPALITEPMQADIPEDEYDDLPGLIALSDDLDDDDNYR